MSLLNKNLVFDVYYNDNADECYKYDDKDNVYLIPEGSKILIELSQDSIDEFADEYRFEPASKVMELKGSKLVNKINEIGPYNSKKLKKLKKQGINTVKTEGKKSSNIQYLGYIFRKKRSDVEDEDNSYIDSSRKDSNASLVLVYKAKVEYVSYSEKIDCYFAVVIKDPIIKKGMIYNKQGKVNSDYCDTYTKIDIFSTPVEDLWYEHVNEFESQYKCTARGHIPKSD